MNDKQQSMKFKFWGVRGSIPISEPNVLEYGGNTSCMEVILDSTNKVAPCILFDAGTGIIQAGQDILNRKVKNIFIFISHTHWDHIQGLPFFAPFYEEDYNIKLYSLEREEDSLENMTKNIMDEPYMPSFAKKWKANIEFFEFKNYSKYNFDKYGFQIETTPINHPIVSTAYKITYQNKALCYVTDTSPFNHILFDEKFISEAPDINQPLGNDKISKIKKMKKDLIKICYEANVVIYDTMFSEKEYLENPHWGHSTVPQAMEICQKARAKMLIAFHHAPGHNDSFMNNMINNYKNLYKNNLTVLDVAKENKIFKL